MNIEEPAEPPQGSGIAAAYLGLVLIWSTTPLAVVLSLRDLDAVWALALRMVLAACLAQGVLRLTGLRLAFDRLALKRYAIGALSMFGAMLFTYLGARHLPSGLISILFGLSPLIVGVLGRFFFRGARFSALQWSSLLLALTGLVLIFLQGEKLARIDSGSVALVSDAWTTGIESSGWASRTPDSPPSPDLNSARGTCPGSLASLRTVTTIPPSASSAAQHSFGPEQSAFPAVTAPIRQVTPLSSLSSRWLPYGDSDAGAPVVE